MKIKIKKTHDALINLKTPPDLLLEQIIQHSSTITADIIELMNFDRLPITKVLFELAHTKNINDMSPITKVIVKAKAYVAYRSLAKNKLITSKEAKTLLIAGQLTADEIALLKKSDIDHIKLNFS